MDFDINDLTSIGAISDTPAYQLPPEAFTRALNMRCRDGGLEQLLGWESVFGTPSVAPHFAIPVKTATGNLWVYTSLTHAYAYDGTTHAKITRQAAGVDVLYTANDTPDWNGTLLGGVPILNNGADVPQFWSPTTLATKLQNLTNWPSTARAKVVRAFGPFLIAIYITKSGTAYPHMVKWSHPADPGSIPSSWDETDSTKDTGEKDLSDVNSGLLRDALPLGDTMFLYKDSATWKMRYIGGRSIFDFGQSAWLPSVGILAPRCVCVTGDGLRHVVVTQDDVIWHNGNSVKSILDKRQKRRLFNEMDTTNFGTTFVFPNPAYNEVWLCYPASGSTYPNKALIMNYGESPDSWTVTEADGITFRGAAFGTIESPDEETWEANENTWEVEDGPWSELLRRRVILCGTAATKFYNLDRGATRDGVALASSLQRTGLSLIGKKRDGSPIVDHQKRKTLLRVQPKVQGGPITVRFASQEVVDGPVSWGASAAYAPATMTYADPGPAEGRAVGLEFAGTSAAGWRIDGYKIQMMVGGDF